MANKKAETTTTESEDNTEQLAREECARLGRQLRLMENDKKAYLEESNAAINQQRKTIRALEEENRKIETELEAQRTKKTETIEGTNLTKVLDLVDQYLALENEVKTETKTINEVQKQLSFASARLAKLKARVEASSSAAGKIIQISNKEIDTKEFTTNRKLETVTSQFDFIVSENSDMRTEIDAILKENVRVMKRCKELEHISNKNKREIDDLVDQATSAYDQREEAVAKSNVLFERNEKEKKQYILEISELKRLIRHEEKLLDFMSTKNQDRIFLETDDERLSRLESAKEHTTDEALESYQENLTKLLTPQSNTLTSLVEEYEKLWSDNINRFNYINELNIDLETLQAGVETLREEIKDCAIQTVEMNEEKTAEIIKNQEDLELLKDEFESVETLVSSYKEHMDEIIKLIERMFFITDFEEAKPVLELIATNKNKQKEVSSQNALLYLNILESRITEIFSMRRGSGFGSGRMTPRSPRPSYNELSASRPRIVISGQTISVHEDNSEDEVMSLFVEEEPSPLEYFTMRGKLLDNIPSRNPSDTDSVFNDD